MNAATSVVARLDGDLRLIADGDSIGPFEAGRSLLAYARRGDHGRLRAALQAVLTGRTRVCCLRVPLRMRGEQRVSWVRAAASGRADAPGLHVVVTYDPVVVRSRGARPPEKLSQLVELLKCFDAATLEEIYCALLPHANASAYTTLLPRQSTPRPRPPRGAS